MKEEFIRWQETIATPEQLTLSDDSQWNLFVDWYTGEQEGLAEQARDRLEDR